MSDVVTAQPLPLDYAAEEENRRLKQMVAEQALDIQALKAVTAKNW